MATNSEVRKQYWEKLSDEEKSKIMSERVKKGRWDKANDEEKKRVAHMLVNARKQKQNS